MTGGIESDGKGGKEKDENGGIDRELRQGRR